MALRKIGQILVDLGFIIDEQLEMLLEEQQQHPGELLGKIAVEMGLVTEEQICQALAEQMNMQIISLPDVTIPVKVIDLVTEPMAQLYRVIPVKFDDATNTLTVATSNPQNLSIQDELRTFLGFDIKVVIAPPSDITRALDRFYAVANESVESIVLDLERDEDLRQKTSEFEGSDKFNLTDAEQLAESAPVRKLLNMVLLLAIKDHASDIHFEPFEEEFRIRIKADGVLFEMVPPPRHLAFAITTRIKVMANLDIAERRLPQDGRIKLRVSGREIDVRTSVIPMAHGEGVVMRILDKGNMKFDLRALGMNEEVYKTYSELIKLPHGIILVTGPTGSGKSTTLYSALAEVSSMENNVCTVEDPIEYNLPLINQFQVQERVGLTFSKALRTLLRQDPDVIMVGEVRDEETARTAIQAALTGHLVFSTLHTNDAASAITRLINMGVEPYLIGAGLNMVLAQRLVRRICPKCREAFEPPRQLRKALERMGYETDKIYKGVGCRRCRNKGYIGRIAVHELLVMTDELRDAVVAGKSIGELRRIALANGMITLRHDGFRKVREGITSVEEIMHIAGDFAVGGDAE